jgi:hypothetical protein
MPGRTARRSSMLSSKKSTTRKSQPKTSGFRSGYNPGASGSGICDLRDVAAPQPWIKRSFLLLFFKKELLSDY